jgi:predicted dehydrogenase
MVGMTHRFYPEVLAARAALASHSIGELLAVRSQVYFQMLPGSLSDWYFHRESAGGGVLTTNGVHSVDSILWLTERRCERIVQAYGRSLLEGHQVEDMADVLFELEPAIPAHVSLLWTEADVRNVHIELTGSEGVLRINSWQGFELWCRDAHVSEVCYPPEASSEERMITGLRSELQAFADACRYKRNSPAPFSQLEQAMSIVSGAYELMLQKRPVLEA